MQVVFLFLITLFFSGNGIAKLNYEPDDEACILEYGVICAEIQEDQGCDFERFLRDDQNRIIGIAGGIKSYKEGSLLVEDITKIGCAHVSENHSYYFNHDADFDNMTCGEKVDFWLELLGQNQWSTDQKNQYYSEYANCVNAADARYVGESCDIIYNDDCYIGGNVYNTSLTVMESDIEGYKSVFKETGYF